MQGLRIRTALQETPVGTEIEVSGWVRTRRDSKAGLSFIELNDGSCFASLQVIAPADLPEYEPVVRQLTTGASITVRGRLVESPAQGQRVELKATSVKLLGEAPPAQYPLQKKQTSLEFLREIGHLRFRTNTMGAVVRTRHHLAMAIHDFFRARDFFYVHTPIITASDCEGAGEMFNVTTLDLEQCPRTDKGEVDYDKDFFAKRAYLTVSGQLQAEAIACALGRVYTFGPTFRAENSNTARHAAEFWMIEPEVAFMELEGNADLAESFLQEVLKSALTTCEEDLAFFDKRIEPGLLAMLQQVVETPFVRLSYTDAVELLQKSGKEFEFKPQWGEMLQTEHERFLTEEEFKRPVIVMDYPSAKPFYMKLSDDGRTVRAMDVLVPRIGEIIGGSEREARYDVLARRLEEQGMPRSEYEWYLDLRKYGTVPHAGFGLGFERLIMFATGMKNIRDVLPFPRTPRHADF